MLPVITPIFTPLPSMLFLEAVNFTLFPLLLLVLIAAAWVAVAVLLIRRAWPSKWWRTTAPAPRYKRTAAM